MSNLKTVLNQLASDKIKERHEGIAALRTTFSQNRAVERLDADGRGQTWLVVFQALFKAVVAEKVLYDKKPGDTAERRLREAASAVRWLTERVVDRLNRKVIRALLAQLLDMIVHRGKLFAPVALDYVKALKTIISFQPHMDHLDDNNWITILRLAFNVVLRDPPRSAWENGDGEMDDSTFDAFDDEDNKGDIVLDSEDDEDPPSHIASARSKKRRRVATPSSRRSTPVEGPASKIRLTGGPHAASNEQVEFASILLILLRARSAPLLSPEHAYLPSAVLRRLQRFPVIYPAETSLHRDYLLTVSATLSHLALNRKHDVETFTRHTWSSLVELWGTGAKSRYIKEALIPVLQVLFPFLTVDDNSSSSWKDSVSKLWFLLDGEAETRWGVDGLSLDCLRLEVASVRESEEDGMLARPFVAQTFRAGWHFDPGQALAWAILELQADCTEKLFVLSESIHSTSGGSEKAEGKRARLENPVASLLHSIQGDSTLNVRAYHLQILLFFIDRHWSSLHDSIQQDAINTLLQFVSSEDGIIQSWTFLCLASIAHHDGSSDPTSNMEQPPSQTLSNGRSRDPITWDPIWTHSIRRANVPAVCRAACHTGFVLLLHSKRLLTSPRVLLEIETLAKDLDVQGPSLPYDSVCVFLAKCLVVASQDVRLYRMQLEEKVLNWLVDSWRMENGQVGKSRMASHTVADMLALLEGICGFSNRSDLVCNILLPDCPITDTVVEQANTKVIRDFLLNARLPPSRRLDPAGPPAKVSTGPRPLTDRPGNLAEPIGRERKLSAFMLKSLDALILEWDGANNHSTAEKTRRSIDVAVMAITFESLLVLNGTRSNKRVMQAAGKLLIVIAPILTDSRWTMDELALVLLGFGPLIAVGREGVDFQKWEAMLHPGVGTGIKSETLRTLRSVITNNRDRIQGQRRDLQRIIWQDADVQHVFGSVLPTFKEILRSRIGNIAGGPTNAMDIDYSESFAPIRNAQATADSQKFGDASAARCVAEVCISSLAVIPVLESSSGEPTRDKELTELVLKCSDERFFLAARVFFTHVRQRILSLSPNGLQNFLDKFSSLVTSNYTYGRREEVLLLLIHFLRSTLRVWLQDNIYHTETGKNVSDLLHWLSHLIKNKTARSWRVRDAITVFFDDYLSQDPTQKFWRSGDDSSEGPDFEPSDILPATLIPHIAADDDIRVRFRAAVANARLFLIVERLNVDPMNLYRGILSCLTKDIDDFERMLTRILNLGNIMVVSSAVRRGPYWHILETSLHANGGVYNRHIICVLREVSERMGLAPSTMFEVYASQIAYSIRQAGHDFLRFPPHVLGYANRRECAENTFRAFTPTNVLAGGPNPKAVAHGQKLFANHCRAIQKSVSDGLRECFGDVIGIQIVSWMDEHRHDPKAGILDSLDDVLQSKTKSIVDFGDFDDVLSRNIDGVVAAILRTLNDHDYSKDGPIVRALQSTDSSGGAARVFQQLSQYRHKDKICTHEPNLPAFPTITVLPALDWFSRWKPDLQTAHATTYHVIHELLADIQRSPLVNEQIRLLNAICVWVAFRRDEFKNPTLLHTLIQGASSLLAQSDLARTAQSILEWCFACYRKNASKDPRFPDVLIRISCSAHDYARTDDTEITQLGTELLHWVNDQFLQLCRVPLLRGQVVKALPALPHQPSPELSHVYEDIKSETLSALLGDHRIMSNKFRLVRRLTDRAIQNQYGGRQFSACDFWRLKACIPPAEQLQDSDIDTFASLLVLNKGQIQSVGTEQNLAQSVRDRHRRGLRKRTPGPTTQDSSPQQSIVLSLLAMLDGTSPAQVHVAYRTLRLLMSTSDLRFGQLASWPPEHHQELEFLQTYPRTPSKRPDRDLNELLTSEDFLRLTNFPEWISKVTVLISDTLASYDMFYAHLTPILQSDIDYAEDMLPVLIHILLHTGIAKRVASQVSVRTIISQYLTTVLASNKVNVACLRSVVDTVLHLRNFQPDGTSDALAHDKWLDINFTLLAKNAVICGAYTTALLFLELASEHQDTFAHKDPAVEQILFDIYSHIDEPDGFYGIQTSDLRQFLIERFHHEKQWEKALRFHGAAFEAGRTDSSAAEGLLQSFHAFGFDHLAIGTLQSGSLGNPTARSAASNMSYRLGWRTETWDLPDQNVTSGNSLYFALRAIHRERDPTRASIVVRHALSSEMERLRNVGPENLAEIRQVIQNLMCLNQITHWRRDLIQRRIASKHIDLNEWGDFVDMSSDFEFSDLESIMATRVSLVRSVRHKEERDQIGDMIAPFARDLIALESNCLVRLSEAARDARQMQVALNSIVRAQQLESVASFAISQEFASVLWLQNEQKLAVEFLKELVRQIDSYASPPARVNETRKALMLARLGSWSAEACLEKPTDILAHFFDPAIQLISGITADSLQPCHASAYHQCAIFAEHQYHSIVKSPDGLRWKVYMDRKTQEIQDREVEILKSQRDNATMGKLKDYQDKAKKQLEQDKQSFSLHEDARQKFLRQAIYMCARCLEISDSFNDDAAIRLCSLWFANFSDNGLQDVVKEALDRVASRKLVFLAHQLSARMSTTEAPQLEESQLHLQDLMLRMCREHPFHSLYQVYCLRADRSGVKSDAPRRSSSRLESPASQSARAAAASNIWDKLSQDSTNAERVRAVEIVCDACLEWAKLPIKANPRFNAKNGKKAGLSIPQSVKILSIKSMRVPVVTVHTPLDPTLRYSDCTWIEGYDPTFDIAGGVNLPKITRCIGSDGLKYKQLFKGEGEDDLRQDAVMEQVFDLVNMVLRRDRETRRRNLSVRCYKVIPLASQAGVLEFVVNTIPLLPTLSSMHRRYHPTDVTSEWFSGQLKAKRAECGKGSLSLQPVIDLFLSLRKKFRPVMRHYFTERHKNPIAWFAMRLSYTRSVATTSIVGHVLGLGDRHLSNILLDAVTGEVVHIDLGIAFDQGKLLPVPERVPFRMTADIIDGMGTSGTQGVFQRCAEETLRVLREGSEVIMTVLEVFKHDPLHQWTASEVKVHKVQDLGSRSRAHSTSTRPGDIGIDITSGTADEAADRALSSVARKLDKSLSVEYTVNELIAEATDPVNLALIFYGWGPHL